MENEKLKEEIEKYLNDFDNLIDTGWFPSEDISDFVCYHKGMTLKDIVLKGREYIRLLLVKIKNNDINFE